MTIDSCLLSIQTVLACHTKRVTMLKSYEAFCRKYTKKLGDQTDLFSLDVAAGAYMDSKYSPEDVRMFFRYLNKALLTLAESKDV